MNFSAPGSGHDLANQSPATPLIGAKTFLDELLSDTTMAEYRNLLSYLNISSYMMVADPTNTADPIIQDVHTRADFGNIMNAMRLLVDSSRGFSFEYKVKYYYNLNYVSGKMLEGLNDEYATYISNMTILYSQFTKMIKTDLEENGNNHKSAKKFGFNAIGAIEHIRAFVGAKATAPYHHEYLSEIARYWRKWGGISEARKYEDVWTFVSGRVLVQE